MRVARVIARTPLCVRPLWTRGAADAQLPWAVALALYAGGAQDCTAGAQSQDDALVANRIRAITQGTVWLAKVTARIRQLGGF